MPISFRFDPDLHTLFYEFSGEVGEAELLEVAAKVASDSSIPPGRRELVDLSGLEHTSVSAGTLRRVAQLFADNDRTPEQSKVAVVAPRDLFFGLSRMYEAYREGSAVRIRIFRSGEEARAWLELANGAG